ncbi:MAG TPA: TolC family protein [Bryobacteraceae bacterium]|nr:TolC family protein [Bryobacteraceae bacterium]
MRSTLSNHPGISIQEQQVVADRGLELQAASIFYPVWVTSLTQQRSYIPLTALDQLTYLADGYPRASAQVLTYTDLNSSYTKLEPNGIQVILSTDANRSEDNLLDNFGANRSISQFRIVLPLLAGRGRDVVEAADRAAAVEVNAALLDLNQTISQLMVNTAQSYWNLVAAKKFLKVAGESVERGAELVEDTRALIEADQEPRYDIHDASANLADRKSNQIAAEQAVIDARWQLALNMGLKPQEMTELPDAADDFPEEPELNTVEISNQVEQLCINAALQNRADVLAARKRQDSARILLRAAKDTSRPRLDLSIGAGYEGLREGTWPDKYLTSFLLGGRGPDLVGTLTFTNANKVLARGKIMQAQAQVSSSQLQTLDVERSVSGSVIDALFAIHNSLLRLRNAAESVIQFRQALAGEQKKLRLGAGSIISALTVEDRLTTALTEFVSAQLAYPAALAQLRFAMGAIVAPDKSVHTIDERVFRELPQQLTEPKDAH